MEPLTKEQILARKAAGASVDDSFPAEDDYAEVGPACGTFSNTVDEAPFEQKAIESAMEDVIAETTKKGKRK